MSDVYLSHMKRKPTLFSLQLFLVINTIIVLINKVTHPPRWTYNIVIQYSMIYEVLHTVIFFFFSIPFIIFALLFSLAPSRNSDPGSHSRLFSPPTHYGSCLAFLSREDFSSSLVDSPRRIVLTHARCSQQLIFFLFLQINSKSRHGRIRTHGPTLLAFERYH